MHRDLKPGNVLLSPFGPRVIDFGIARALDAAAGLTQTGAVLGSRGWMAPEQLAGAPVTPAADVFARGGLVLFAATGRPPFGTGTPDELASRILARQPDLGPLPESLRRSVAAALDKDPARRPTSRALLDALLGGPATDERVAVTPVLQRTWVQERPRTQTRPPAPRWPSSRSWRLRRARSRRPPGQRR